MIRFFKRTLGFLFILFNILMPLVHACEPCPGIWNFEESVKKSDLIIIGQKVREGPRSDFGKGYGGPDWIEVKILKALKGSAQTEKIKVNSWDAMCDYGINIENEQPYVMFLSERNVSNESYQYDALNYGCAVKTYPFNAGFVMMDEKKISLDEFTKELNSFLK